MLSKWQKRDSLTPSDGESPPETETSQSTSVDARELA
jgi:hypothetical protein